MLYSSSMPSNASKTWLFSKLFNPGLRSVYLHPVALTCRWFILSFLRASRSLRAFHADTSTLLLLLPPAAAAADCPCCCCCCLCLLLPALLPCLADGAAVVPLPPPPPPSLLLLLGPWDQYRGGGREKG